MLSEIVVRAAWAACNPDAEICSVLFSDMASYASARQRLTRGPADSAGVEADARATGREIFFVFNIDPSWGR